MTGSNSVMCHMKLIACASLLLLLGGIMSRSFATMSLTGPITASTVTVSGDVTVSSMTISTLTVTSQLNTMGTAEGIKGLVLQTKSSSTAVQFSTTNTTFTAVPGLSVSLALSSATNYVRISLSGALENFNLSSTSRLSISRDGADLGAGSLATATSYPGLMSVGIVIVDLPGDTNSHIYEVIINNSGIGPARFPTGSTGFLLAEEISQ